MSDSKSSPLGAQLSADFVPVDDEKEARLILKESASTVASVMLWTKNQEKVLQTHLSAFSESESTLFAWVPPGEKPEEFSQVLSKIPESECYFSLSAPQANIFFKAKYIGFDDGGLKFGLPQKIFKVQRRKDFRFQIPQGHVLRVEFEDLLDSTKTLRPKVLDISAGGLAFIVDETEEALFTQGLKIRNIQFQVKGRKITAHGEVRHKRPLPPESQQTGYKVGVIFLDLKPADHQYISAYVLEESRKYFSKFY